MRFFLSGIFILFICMSLHAEENVIFYGNAVVYGKENLVVAHNTSPKPAKKVITKTKEEKHATPPKENLHREQTIIVFPTLPFDSSSSAFSQDNSESGAISSHQRIGGDEQPGRACWGSAYSNIEKSILTVIFSKQRHKLSIAAIQCGMLTSIGSQSPPLLTLKIMSLRA